MIVAARIVLVVAVAENGVIGRGGKLPWRMPSDLRTFRRLTLGKPVIMGRRTFQSIGRPLDGRDNVVVTRDPGFRSEGVIVKASLDDAIAEAGVLAGARGSDEIAVIGGSEIYAAALATADRIYLTRVHAEVDGDAVFPAVAADEWTEIERSEIPADPRDDHLATLIVYDRLARQPEA